jgi:uncharacterized protein with WD repeat
MIINIVNLITKVIYNLNGNLFYILFVNYKIKPIFAPTKNKVIFVFDDL